MTREEFINVVGQEPVKDDLPRANCKKAGKAGHRFCGVCPEHAKPRFFCGCFNRGEAP